MEKQEMTQNPPLSGMREMNANETINLLENYVKCKCIQSRSKNDGWDFDEFRKFKNENEDKFKFKNLITNPNGNYSILWASNEFTIIKKEYYKGDYYKEDAVVQIKYVNPDGDNIPLFFGKQKFECEIEECYVYINENLKNYSKKWFKDIITHKDFINNNLKECTNFENVYEKDIVVFKSKHVKKIEILNFINNKLEVLKDMLNLISEVKPVIFNGAPGTGKTYKVRNIVKALIKDNSDWEFVQFHPSFDYSDFIEGLRPVEINNSTSFVRMDGIFKKFCRKIVNEGNNDKTYYFIIDEINRSDLSKVLGEVMFCLEPDYRGKDNSVKTQLSNLPSYEINDEGNIEKIENDCFKDGFYIPKNLKIIGTMNDIDRSVDSMDFALRRRFNWFEITAELCLKETLIDMLEIDEKEAEKLSACINEMNNIISGNYNLGSSYCVGAAYFKGYNSFNLSDIFDNNIKPLLKEYLRGNAENEIDELIEGCKNALMGNVGVKSNE